MNTFESLLAIITLVPALAWFVTAFAKLYQMSVAHKDEIKKMATDVKETVEEKTHQIKARIESNKNKQNESNTPDDRTSS